MYKVGIITLALVGAVLGAPGHSKTIVLESNEIPPFPLAGGSENTGADTSEASGAQVLGHVSDYEGGSSASASADASIGGGVSGGIGGGSGGGYNHGSQGTFFDKIFNIPISILHSVNSHLNNRSISDIPTRPVVRCRRHRCAVKKVPVAGATVPAGGEFYPSAGGSDPHASAGAGGTFGAAVSAGAGASAGPGIGGSHDLQKSAPTAGGAVFVNKPPGYYDGVFAIPITALKSVNQLLNGK